MTTIRSRPQRHAWIEGCAYALLFASLLVGAFLRLLPGVNPHTLYLDDQWVGALANVPVAEILATPSAVPLGFTLLSRASLSIGTDPEIALQVVPIFFYMGSIVLLGGIVFRLSRTVGAALLASYFLAANHELAVHAVRVKQFSADVFCILAVVFLSLSYLAKPTTRRLALLCATSAAVFTLSFMSLLVSACAVPACAVVALWRREQSRAPGLVVCLLFLLPILLQYLLLVRYQTPESVYTYWNDFYLPTSSWHDWRRQFEVSGRRIMIQSLPPGFFPTAYAIPASLAAGALYQWSRFVAVLVISSSIGFISAATLRFVPFGGGRTDLFLIPLILLALFSGLTLLRFLRDRWQRIVSAALGLFVVYLMICREPSKVGYIRNWTEKAAVEYIAANATTDDCVIVFPDAMWLTAFYGPWKYHLVKTGRVAHGFDVVIERQRTLTIPSGRERTLYWQNVALLRSDIDSFFGQTTCGRVFHIAASFDPERRGYVNDLIAGKGYPRAEVKDFMGASVHIFRGAKT